jgi:hypothetical protein
MARYIKLALAPTTTEKHCGGCPALMSNGGTDYWCDNQLLFPEEEGDANITLSTHRSSLRKNARVLGVNRHEKCLAAETTD